MRWYEYKMETDDLRAPDDLKAKLLAMTDQLTEEEKNQPMMKAAAPAAPVQKAARKKAIHFPLKQVGTLAACLAVCAVGYGALTTNGSIGFAKSSAPAEYSAASVAAAGPVAADYSLDTLSLENSADNGISTFSADDAAGSARSAENTGSAKIIYTAHLSLESRDYAAARAALDAAAAEAGGYLESSSEYASAGESRSASLAFRIPQENYQSFLAAVAAAGNVTYKNQQAEDVTAQYMDVETRLANLEAQRTRLQQLQQQADNLSDLLEVETALTDVQSQIESWQSQLDWYSSQVEECTVYVGLSEVETYSPTGEGFGARVAAAFATGWQSFVNGVQQLAVGVAGAWPVVVLVVVAAAGVLHWRKKKK